MADTDPKSETAPKEPLKNDATPPTPQLEEKKTEDGELEAARKKAEQAEMRANQLAKQLKEKEDAEAAAKTKELEDKEEFKNLYEQEKLKREEIERERDAEEQRRALRKAEKGVLADYSDEVAATAKDLGLRLSEISDEAVAEFKSKLDKLNTHSGNQRVTPNNPGKGSAKKEYTGEEIREILKDPVRRDAYYRSKGGVTAMMMNPQQ